MYAIIGLGNPGRKYENTRHNLGFIAIDLLADELGVTSWRARFKSLIGETRIGTEKVILVKPQTFMNLSGRRSGRLLIFTSSSRKSLSCSMMISIFLKERSGFVRTEAPGHITE